MSSMNFSQETVQEFQLSEVNFDIATPISSGGAINVVTRSEAMIGTEAVVFTATTIWPLIPTCNAFRAFQTRFLSGAIRVLP